MKSILNYLKEYWQEQNIFHLLFVAIFLTIAIHLNYKYDIENGVIDIHYQTFKHFYLYFILYSCGFIPIYLSYAYNKSGREMLSQPGLWLRIFVGLLAFCTYCYIYQYKTWIQDHVTDYRVSAILKICADQFVQATVLFILIVAFWFWKDRKNQRLYGLKIDREHLNVYLLMLAAMVPLIVAASFTKDFQEYYPTARRVLKYCEEGMPKGWYVTLYEFCYGLEFFHIEFFFRGFLILAFVRFAGSRAILPAAVFYCFIHFGKPMGECISSFLGGMILGILSYRSESIIAGVFIHMGIALLMELVAGIWLWHLTSAVL